MCSLSSFYITMAQKAYASSRSPGNLITIIICAIASIPILAWLFSSLFPTHSTSTSSTQHQSLHSERLIKYCSINEFQGEEGKYLDANQFELKALVITIRHGDRSAIHQIPGKYSPPDINNEEKGKPTLYDPNVSLYTPSADRFSIVPISGSSDFDRSGGDPGQGSGVSFTDALDAVPLFGRSDLTLPQGQLTSTGFMQHIHLGDHLQRAYASFMKSVSSAKEVYIRSTNYHRTIQVNISVYIYIFIFPLSD